MNYECGHLKLLLVFSLIFLNLNVSQAAINLAGVGQQYGVSSSSPDYIGTYTWMVWVRRDYNDTGANGHPMMTRQTGDATPTCSQFVPRFFQDKIQILNNYGLSATVLLQGTVNVGDLKWHSYVVTHSGTTFSLYIDGTLDTTSIISYTTNTGCAETISYGVGGNSCGIGDLGTCFMAEFALIPSILTLSEIKAFSTGSTVSMLPRAPANYYRMDHATSLLSDLSKNLWNATPASHVSDVNAFHCPCGMPTGEGK